MKKSKIFFIIILVILTGCKSSVRISGIDYAHSYNPLLHPYTPFYEINHTCIDSSRLILTLPAEQLLYSRDGREEFFMAQLKINLMLFSSYDSKHIIDSVQLLVRDTLFTDEPDRLIRHEIPLASPPGATYQLYINLRDIKRRAGHNYTMLLDKRHPLTNQFFSFEDPQNNIYKPPFFLPLNSDLHISYSIKADQPLILTVYPRPEKIPVPPWVATGDEQIPSPAFTSHKSSIPLTLSQGRGLFRTGAAGLYHFHEAGNTGHGFVAYAYHQGFPHITAGESLLLPLRYITAWDEYQQLFMLGNPELAAERFWNRTAGNPDRAVELSRQYYSRASSANMLFSSFLPGWQTDRGMIYIIYGPPQRVFRTENSESWQYLEQVNSPSVTFVFSKISNPYTENHYVLQRDPAFRNSWNRAVGVWRR